MNKEELIKILGLDENATDEQIMTAIKAGAQAVEELATERTKAEAAEAEKDQAIAEGRISVAGRPAWEKRLKDDFAAGSVALANEKPLKTASAVTQKPGEQTKVDLVALANERMQKNPSLTYPAAFAAVMKEHPEVK